MSWARSILGQFGIDTVCAFDGGRVLLCAGRRGETYLVLWAIVLPR